MKDEEVKVGALFSWKAERYINVTLTKRKLDEELRHRKEMRTVNSQIEQIAGLLDNQ